MLAYVIYMTIIAHKRRREPRTVVYHFYILLEFD